MSRAVLHDGECVAINAGCPPALSGAHLRHRAVGRVKPAEPRPTIFLCSGVIEHRAAHWWMHPAAAGTDIERLKRLPNRERLAQLHERGYHGAELRQVLPVLTGDGLPEESMNAHEGRDGAAPTGLSVRQVKQIDARAG
ncbi:hypothetical protein [Mycetohabitans sp. B46]|uniref:hypothetical protein n=1 Tax=Mycetohabitans sp. B46 TaxID=2772536 RepID=UPI00307F1336